MTRDYIAIARKYSDAVIACEVPACEYVKQACERYLRDLESQNDALFPFALSTTKAERACVFIELLPHVEGPLAGQLIILSDWQVFIVVNIFGWVRKDTKARRFRKAYVEVPRGNGKSTFVAAIGLLMTVADGEAGAQVYSAATTKDQAKIVFNAAHRMAKKSPGMRKRFRVQVPANAIVQPESFSIFKALAADDDKLDGLNVHLGIIDELHAHPDRGVYDVIETGAGKRLQSLLLIITTAGNDRSGICYEIRGYLIKVLASVIEDDSTFGVIYTIDLGDPKHSPPIPGDDWKNPEAWRKANPNWGISVMPEYVEQLAKKAMATPSAVNNFLTKHLDVWVNADVAWMDMTKWRAGADPSLKLEDFSGVRCYGAVDLASKIDIAAAILLFIRDLPAIGSDGEQLEREDGTLKFERHYYCFEWFYLPEDTIKSSSNSQYSGWVRSGHIEVTPGTTIDFDEIETELKKWPSRFDIVGVAYDPFQATQMSTHMIGDGFPMIEVRATVLNFSDPMKEFDAAVRSGRFHHAGNPAMEWMVSNVVCHYDKKDNIYPNKERPENKIDGPVSVIMALNRARLDSGESAWDGKVTKL